MIKVESGKSLTQKIIKICDSTNKGETIMILYSKKIIHLMNTLEN